MFFKKIQKNLKKFEISFLFQKTKKQKQKKDFVFMHTVKS
jgi:hypothetical protein